MCVHACVEACNFITVDLLQGYMNQETNTLVTSEQKSVQLVSFRAADIQNLQLSLCSHQ